MKRDSDFRKSTEVQDDTQIWKALRPTPPILKTLFSLISRNLSFSFYKEEK